jgi:hypothetical protein
MPNAAEGFIIIMIAVVGLTAARLLTLGDALGGVLRRLVGRDKKDDPADEAS